METQSAIVVLVNGDVHSVYMVPAAVASIDNMDHLRKLRDKLQQKHGITDDITLMRVWVTDDDQNAKTLKSVEAQLENVISNLY